MGGHGGQTQLAIGLSRQGSALSVLLEPQDRRAEDAALAQIVSDPGLNHTEVLANHQRARPLRLEHQDADQGLVVVADVGALTGGQALRNPPQPEEADDMVDPDAASMAQDSAQHVSIRGVAELLQPVWPPRWLAPVLAKLVVLVWRGTNRDLTREGISKPPGISAFRMDTDREVMDDPDRHPGFLGLPLHRTELLINDPLQPAIELHLVADLITDCLHGRAAWVLQVRGPVTPRQPFLLGQRTPRSEVEQTLAFAVAESGEGPLPTRRPRLVENGAQGRRLGRPDRVTVDRVRRVQRPRIICVPLQQLPLCRGHVAHLRDVLDPDVDRVEEAPRRGQIGRGLDRGYRLARMQRVHQDEVRAQVGRGPSHHVAEISEVPQTPGLTGPYRVQLAQQAPRPSLLQRGWQDHCCG